MVKSIHSSGHGSPISSVGSSPTESPEHSPTSKRASYNDGHGSISDIVKKLLQLDPNDIKDSKQRMEFYNLIKEKKLECEKNAENNPKLNKIIQQLKSLMAKFPEHGSLPVQSKVGSSIKDRITRIENGSSRRTRAV